MKSDWGVCVLLILLTGCSSTPEKRAADEQKREAELKAQEQKKQAEQANKLRQERERIIQKYTAFSTEQLRTKAQVLDIEIARGWAGQGIGLFIAKASYDGKVSERDDIAKEISRREGSARAQRISSTSSDDGNPVGSGTGFFITEDGFLVTNEHVVKESTRIRLLTSSGNVTA